MTNLFLNGQKLHFLLFDKNEYDWQTGQDLEKMYLCYIQKSKIWSAVLINYVI